MAATDDSEDRNVYGDPLQSCSRDPTTGYLRDGHCRHTAQDRGRHEVCAAVTEEFLRYSRAQGNDLITPRPEFDFPGLDPGDHWCLCLGRWLEAHEADRAPPVVLEATNEAVLDEVSMDLLESFAHEA